MWIQTGGTVRKRLNGVMTSVTLTFDLWPWPFAWTSLLSLVITPENFMMIWWWEHSQKGVTDGQTDRQTDGKYHSLSCLVAAKNRVWGFWAQILITRHYLMVCFKKNSICVYFFFQVELQQHKRYVLFKRKFSINSIEHVSFYLML